MKRAFDVMGGAGPHPPPRPPGPAPGPGPGPGPGGDQNAYPVRPGQPDCAFFMKTGLCSFGTSCKFNHPPGIAKAPAPPRVNFQGICSQFMKGGWCTYGENCKYSHDPSGIPVSIGAPSFSPDPVGAIAHPQQSVAPSCAYQLGPPSGAQPSSPGVAADMKALIANSRQVDYVSIVKQCSGSLHVPGMPAAQPVSQAYAGAPAPPAGQIKDTRMPCPHFLRGGSCLFGEGCRSRHVTKEELDMEVATGVASYALPIRPGVDVCRFYMRTGECHYGPGCKWHHPPDRDNPDQLGPAVGAPTAAAPVAAMEPTTSAYTSNTGWPQQQQQQQQQPPLQHHQQQQQQQSQNAWYPPPQAGGVAYSPYGAMPPQPLPPPQNAGWQLGWPQQPPPQEAGGSYGGQGAIPPQPAEVQRGPEPPASFAEVQDVKARHILIKHSGSRNPTSHRDPSGTNIRQRSLEEAVTTLLRMRSEAQQSEEAFARLAQEWSDCSSFKRGGDLGRFKRGKMQPLFETATFALPVGSTSDVVQTASGAHLIMRTG